MGQIEASGVWVDGTASIQVSVVRLAQALHCRPAAPPRRVQPLQRRPNAVRCVSVRCTVCWEQHSSTWQGLPKRCL